jgi:tellurite resistance protein
MARDHSSWNAIMQYSFLKVFANDGIIDASELAMLQRLALEDGQVDEKERKVLSGVFARVEPQTLDPQVRDEIARFKAQYAIP